MYYVARHTPHLVGQTLDIVQQYVLEEDDGVVGANCLQMKGRADVTNDKHMGSCKTDIPTDVNSPT
jgi:hypothetical protein